jgi:hypothetical protein
MEQNRAAQIEGYVRELIAPDGTGLPEVREGFMRATSDQDLIASLSRQIRLEVSLRRAAIGQRFPWQVAA